MNLNRIAILFTLLLVSCNPQAGKNTAPPLDTEPEVTIPTEIQVIEIYSWSNSQGYSGTSSEDSVSLVAYYDGGVHPLAFRWQQTSGYPVEIQNSLTSEASFIAPTLAGIETLGFTFTVTDAEGSTSTDFISIEIASTMPSISSPPTIDFWSWNDLKAMSGDVLDIKTSVEDYSSSLTYSWRQTAGIQASIENSDFRNLQVTAPAVQKRETLTFELTVTNKDGLSAVAAKNLVVDPMAVEGQTPTFKLGNYLMITAEEGIPVTLFAAAQDPNGNTMTYSWKQTFGTPVTLSDQNADSVNFNAPTVTKDEKLSFAVEVTDSQGYVAYGDFDLVVYAHELLDNYEENDSPEQAANVPLGDTISGISTCNDLDYFSYTFNERALVTIESDVGFCFEQGSCAAANKTTQFVTEAITDYFYVEPLILSSSLHSSSLHYCDLTTEAQAFNFSVSTSTAPEDDNYEPNQISAQLTNIAADTWINGILWNSDAYQLSVPEGYDGIRVHLNLLDNKAPNEATSPSLRLIGPSGGYTIIDHHLIKGSGTYIVDVAELWSRYHGYFGSTYELKWTAIKASDVNDIFEENDSPTTAHLLPEADTVDGILLNRSDDDYFEIQVTSGYQLIEINADFPDDQVTPATLTLTDSSGNSMGYSTTGKLVSVVPQAGSYFIHLDKRLFNDGNANKYSLQWTSTSTPVDDDFEDLSIPVSAGFEIQGVSWDDDNYDFEVLEGSERITVDVTLTEPANGVRVDILESHSSYTITEFNVLEGSKRISLNLPPGTYTALLSPLTTPEGAKYRFSWQDFEHTYVIAPDDQHEYNDVYQAATELPIHTAFENNLTDDSDWFELDYEQSFGDMVVVVQLQDHADTPVCLTVSIHDFKGSERGHRYLKGNESNAELPVPSASSENEVFYVQVAPCHDLSPDVSYTINWHQVGS